MNGERKHRRLGATQRERLKKEWHEQKSSAKWKIFHRGELRNGWRASHFAYARFNSQYLFTDDRPPRTFFINTNLSQIFIFMDSVSFVRVAFGWGIIKINEWWKQHIKYMADTPMTGDDDDDDDDSRYYSSAWISRVRKYFDWLRLTLKVFDPTLFAIVYFVNAQCTPVGQSTLALDTDALWSVINSICATQERHRRRSRDTMRHTSMKNRKKEWNIPIYAVSVKGDWAMGIGHRHTTITYSTTQRLYV